MFYMDSKLGKLVDAEMKRRNLSSREVAKVVGVSHPLIGNIINGEQPSFETCIKLVPFLHIPDVEILRMAGLIKPVSKITSEKERLLYLFEQLPPSEKEELILNLQFKLTFLEQTGKTNPISK